MRLVLLLLPATLLCAQVPSAGGFGIEFRFDQSRLYQFGEAIPVTLRVAGRPAEPALPQERPAVRWQFQGFLVDPPLMNGPDSCGTEAQPCRLGGIISGRMDVDFNRIGDTSTTLLNDYTAAPIVPGRYRVSALARKSVLIGSGPLSATYRDANPPVTVVSNAVELQVVPRTEQWVRETISAAVATVRAGGRDYERTRRAAKQLACIDTPEAWSALLGLIPIEETTLLNTLAATSQPGAVCDLLQARIPAPDQAVTSVYLLTMNTVCSSANVPQPAASNTTIAAVISAEPRPAARAAPADAEREAFFQKQRAYMEDLRRRSTDVLAASLAAKHPGVSRTASMKALLLYLRDLQYGPRGAMPAWAPALASAVASELTTLAPQDRAGLADLFANILPTASAAGAFEAWLDAWTPGHDPEAQQIFKALFKLDPRRARQRLVAELTKDATWLEPSLLTLLRPEDVPPMDDALIDRLGRGQLMGSAVARFATAQAVPRVRAFYEAQQNRCQPELLAYFLRTDEPYAKAVLQASSTQSCLRQYFERTSALILTPTFEEFTAEYLVKGTVFLKTEAAKALGKYGSESAQKPLWAALRYFHEYWDGKAAELLQNGEGVLLEEQLAVALGRARGWVVTEADLRTIQSLCIQERCQYQAGQDLRSAKAPIRLEVYEEGAGLRASIGQYSGFSTIEEIEAKLAQFPRGTQFTMRVSGPSYEAIEAGLRRVASSRGLSVESLPR